jgi:3-hydroxyisobutyrate dehydrogenase-like beta-hydroxyacid dehydrogenase
MVGGEDEVVARARPVIDCFAGRVVHTGPTGSGHAMKLLNNFIAMGYAAIYSEALALAGKAGLTPQVFDAVIRDGRMDCAFYRTFFKYVLERDRDAHKFALRNALKDMNYLAAFALATDVANPLQAATRNSFATAVGLGRGDDYVPMLSDIITGLNGVELAVK